MLVVSIADITGNAAAQQLSATVVQARFVTVKAPSTNTGTVRVGDSSVSATRGHPLLKNESYTFCLDGADNAQLYNLNQLYVFAGASDTLSIIYGA